MVNKKEPNINEVETSNDNWKLYELLWGILKQNHTRWVDNYRIFLSINAFLLPAVTALIVYAIKYDDSSLRFYVFLICIIAVIITWQGMGLIKRILIDSEIRFNQLYRIESNISDMVIRPSKEAKEYFFEKADLPDLPQNKYKNKGIRAIDAYNRISIAIIVYYAIIGISSIWPCLSVIWNNCK